MSEEVLLGFCNRIWNEEKVPEKWKKGLLIKLPKKGDLGHCRNWRDIMLLNMASKVILERVKTAWDKKLRDEQAGFRASRSCMDQINDTENYCGTEYRVAVLLVHQLYRLRKGL